MLMNYLIVIVVSIHFDLSSQVAQSSNFNVTYGEVRVGVVAPEVTVGDPVGGSEHLVRPHKQYATMQLQICREFGHPSGFI